MSAKKNTRVDIREELFNRAVPHYHFCSDLDNEEDIDKAIQVLQSMADRCDYMKGVVLLSPSAFKEDQACEFLASKPIADIHAIVDLGKQAVEEDDCFCLKQWSFTEHYFLLHPPRKHDLQVFEASGVDSECQVHYLEPTSFYQALPTNELEAFFQAIFDSYA